MNAHRQRGLALTEAAIALPILLLVLVPVGEVVRAFVQYSILAHHTRSAVRYVAERAINDTTGVPAISAELAAAAADKIDTVLAEVPGAGEVAEVVRRRSAHIAGMLRG